MLPTKRSAIALARGARTGVLMMRMSMAVKTASNAAVNLASRSRMRNRKRRPASSRSMSRLRACWVSQAPVGWAVTPRMCTRRVACSMTKNAYSRCRVMVSRWNRSQARIACAWARRNSRPGRSGSPRRGVDAGGVQDGPDGGGADLVAEAGEFAVDASVSPGGVLGGQADDQGAQAGGDGRSTGSDGLGGPAAGDELAVPAQDGGRGDEQPEASADWGAVG